MQDGSISRCTYTQDTMNNCNLVGDRENKYQRQQTMVKKDKKWVEQVRRPRFTIDYSICEFFPWTINSRSRGYIIAYLNFGWQTIKNQKKTTGRERATQKRRDEIIFFPSHPPWVVFMILIELDQCVSFHTPVVFVGFTLYLRYDIIFDVLKTEITK